jgi:hypothetical protein
MSITVTAIRRPFNARLLYRWLYKRLFLPRNLVHGLLSKAKQLTVREQILHRRQLAGSLAQRQPGSVSLIESDAYQLFQPEQLPGARETAEHCVELYRQFCAGGGDTEALQRNPSKRFLLSVIAGNEFADQSELLHFMVSRPVLDAVSRYLGTIPVVEGAALWWTPPNESVQSSQAWHIDELAQRQVKIILNCFEVTEDQGPLHFLPANISERVRQLAGHHRGRLADEWIEQADAGSHVRRAIGPAGSGIIFDSSRCLHFGSRGNRRDRLVLTFHYLPLDAPTETRYNLRLSRLPPGCEDLDEVQRLALGFS